MSFHYDSRGFWAHPSQRPCPPRRLRQGDAACDAGAIIARGERRRLVDTLTTLEGYGYACWWQTKAGLVFVNASLGTCWSNELAAVSSNALVCTWEPRAMALFASDRLAATGKGLRESAERALENAA